MLSLILMSPRGKGRALSVFGLLFVLGTARADTTVIAGSLPEDYLPELKVIMGAALRQSPQIIAKEIEIEQAKAGLMGANSRRLPGVGGNLNLASNATATTSNLSTRTRDSGLFYNLAVSQPIFFGERLSMRAIELGSACCFPSGATLRPTASSRWRCVGLICN